MNCHVYKCYDIVLYSSAFCNHLTKYFCTVFMLQSRLAVNSVTSGDYSRPIRISAFMGELNSGFRLLNLKNDSLRKRFDGLKYDIKKIEEVVYDISIRGLRPTAQDAKADPSVETAATQGEK